MPYIEYKLIIVKCTVCPLHVINTFLEIVTLFETSFNMHYLIKQGSNVHIFGHKCFT